ncbi:MAG TPA: NACHT domain-containing protein [Kamptonema sp.]|nr:NACHT domain-containing protein [Kamptonema sp.]
MEKAPREKLLDKVKQEVKAGRSQSLHKAVLLNLHGDNPQQQFRRNWDIELKIGSRPSFPVPQKAGIVQLFDRMDGKLVILGAVGAGKTTTLLELAGKLVNRAENDANLPCPVLLNLAERKDDSVAIADWLVEQIHLKYNIPINISQEWLNQQQLLPLLDGLDRVEKKRQESFIQSINQFIEGDSRPKHLVVCSSFEDYKNCETRFRLRAAILLKPLTETQIREYLIAARSRELWYSIEREPELLKLAKTPLLLTMLTLGYEEILIESWKRLPSAEAQRQYLLNAYIRRQMTREINQHWYSKGKEPRPEQLRNWLVSLAKKMEAEDLTEFSLGNLSPSWLETDKEQQVYQRGIQLITGLIFGLILGLVVGAIAGEIWGFLVGLVAGIIAGIFLKIPAIEIFMLRVVLWRYGYTPWNYQRFLNYASERLLLQRGGDKYRFIHDLLQQHFAEM